MLFRDQTYDLRLQVDGRNYELSPEEREKMESDLLTLRKLLAGFPVADLHVQVHFHARSRDFHVKTRLRLPQEILFTGERHVLFHPAWERCVRKLVRKARAYKERLSSKAEREKHAMGTRHEVRPEAEPDRRKLEEAVRGEHYAAFREAVSLYDDSLRQRLGRWIERYPEINAKLGEEFLLSDVLEEVYLQAFEGYEARPPGRLGDWLESLMEPALRSLAAAGP
jgi:ribosome-associated translation inhibitor RaiA